MNIGESFTRSYPLIPDQVNGKKAFRVGETGGHLARLDMETMEWTVVDSLDRGLSFNELKDSYGIWKDLEVTSGKIWWKKTIRPLDGKVQNDEIAEFMKSYQGTTQQSGKCYTAPKGTGGVCYLDTLAPEARIVLNPDGTEPAAFLQETWKCIEHKVVCM